MTLLVVLVTELLLAFSKYIFLANDSELAKLLKKFLLWLSSQDFFLLFEQKPWLEYLVNFPSCFRIQPLFCCLPWLLEESRWTVGCSIFSISIMLSIALLQYFPVHKTKLSFMFIFPERTWTQVFYMALYPWHLTQYLFAVLNRCFWIVKKIFTCIRL